MVGDIADINGEELINDIKKLFETGKVVYSTIGSYKKIEKDIFSPPEKWHKRELLSIMDR